MMHYVIDFDTRVAESKNKNKAVLEKYIIDNCLDNAVTVIATKDELCLKLSLTELIDFLKNANIDYNYRSEELAAEAVYDYLEDNQKLIPTFTPALGKKLVAAAKKKNSEPTKRTRRKKRSPLQNSIFILGPVMPPEYLIGYKIRETIRDNLGECTFKELSDFKESDIKDALSVNFIEETI